MHNNTESVVFVFSYPCDEPRFRVDRQKHLNKKTHTPKKKKTPNAFFILFRNKQEERMNEQRTTEREGKNAMLL